MKNNAKLVNAFGEIKSIREWQRDERCCVDIGTLYYRISTSKWEPERAITTPSRRHGLGRKHKLLYSKWQGMKNRCYRKNSKGDYMYKEYGGRGIFVCKSWKHDFKEFCDWCLNNGWEPGLEIDRIDNDRGYAPWNCRFVTREQNCNNTRTNHKLTIFGETKTIAEWLRDNRCKAKSFRNRIHKGWDAKKALITPYGRPRHNQ